MRPLPFFILVAVVVSSLLRAENPIIREKYTADPAAIVHDGTVYLYAGHDEDPPGGAEGYVLNEWLCYSSTDMVTWKDEGAVLKATDFAWASGEAWRASELGPAAEGIRQIRASVVAGVFVGRETGDLGLGLRANWGDRTQPFASWLSYMLRIELI